MIRPILLLIFLCVTPLIYAQNEEQQVKDIDSLYKEDQFYFAVTYNLLGDKPSGVSQSGFSSGFHLGYIKDMPLNKRRNIAIGLGLGVSSNSFNQNILIDKIDGQYVYSVLNSNEISYSRNKFTMYIVEAPLEFRWRTSTPESYKFWRIYTGLKFGYLVANSSKFKDSSGKIKHSNISDFNSFQYGITFSAGYSTWNVHLYYGLNQIFNSDAQLNGAGIDMYVVRIGLMLYLL